MVGHKLRILGKLVNKTFVDGLLLISSPETKQSLYVGAILGKMLRCEDMSLEEVADLCKRYNLNESVETVRVGVWLNAYIWPINDSDINLTSDQYDKTEKALYVTAFNIASDVSKNFGLKSIIKPKDTIVTLLRNKENIINEHRIFTVA